MGKKYLTCFFIISVFYFLIASVKAAYAASLQFEPATINVNSGQTFQMSVNIDTNSEKVASTDVRIIYDATLLDVQTVTKGTFFPSVNPYITHDGKLYIAGTVDSAANSKSGTGTIATVQFTTLKNGSGTITFDCTQGASLTTRTSHILKSDGTTDIIQCANNGRVSVTIGGAGGAGGITPTNIITTTPTPSILIKSGVIENTFGIAIPGLLLLIIGIIGRVILI